MARVLPIFSFAFLVGFVFLFPTDLYSQSLAFSRVVLKQGLGSVIDTVPAGKVWKIESVMANSSSKSVYALGINGVSCSLYGELNSSSSAFHDYFGPSGPIWLPEGTRLQGASGALTYTISIIEFTVVP